MIKTSNLLNLLYYVRIDKNQLSFYLEDNDQINFLYSP